MAEAASSQKAPSDAVGTTAITDVLAALIHALSAARSLDEIMGVVSHAVRTLLHADGATFVLRDGDMCHYAEEDAISPLWKGRRFPLTECISGWCMLNNKPAFVPDISKDARIPGDLYRPTFVKSLAMVPVVREEPVAALGAYWSEEREFRAEELERLQAVADAAALALGVLQKPSAAERPQAAPRATPARRASASIRRSLRPMLEGVLRDGPRPTSPRAYAFGILCIALATLARAGVMATGVEGLTRYASYYPAVLLSMLVGGIRAGIMAAVLGGLAADFFFIPPFRQFAPLSISDTVNLALYGGACALIIAIIDWYQRALVRIRHEDARHLTLASEQRHRVKNALAIVETVIRQSLRHEPERARIINQRLRAGLSEVDIGDADTGEPISLRALLVNELEPYDLARFELKGTEEGVVGGDERRLLTLAAHELATNALKYGALSVPDGHVTATWRVADRKATICWAEAGGPPVKPPSKRGFGTIMLRRLIEAAGGALALEHPTSGLRAEISLPLERRRRRRRRRRARARPAP